MATRSVATVFGGSGFIGRYIVKRLAHKGFVVRVAVRDPEAALFLKTAGAVGQIVPLFASVENEATVRRATEGASIVINLVGILAEARAGEFDRVHAEGAGRVARLAAASGVTHLLHMSAIGADPASPSRYGTSKAAGEQAVRAAFPRATIFRPSIVFGPEDRFFNRFAAIARLSPLMPAISGETKLQPVYVGDVADAMMAALGRSDAAGTTYALGGPRVWTFRELLEYVLQQTGRQPAADRCADGVGAAAGAAAGVRAGEAPDAGSVADAVARQRGVGRPARADGPWRGANPGGAGRADGYLQRFRPGGGTRRVLPDPSPGTAPEISFQARDTG